MSRLFLLTVCLCFICIVSLLVVVNQADEEDEYSILKQDWCGDADCYDLLGVSADMDFREIKMAYNNLSLRFHPDKNLNQSQTDKDFYVQVNTAWEILSSDKRAAYDENLRIKAQFDSPKESVIFVCILLYVLIVFVVLQYQKQRHREFRKAILNHQNIQRYFWDSHKIDLSGHKQPSKKKKKKNKKKFGKKSHGDWSDGNSSEHDLQQLWESITDEQINGAIEQCQILVPGWKPFEPSYQRAALDVPIFFLWCFTEGWFHLTWQMKYKVLKRPYSDHDREQLCRRHFQKSSREWSAMDSPSREALLVTPGVWRKRPKSSPSPKRRSPKKAKQKQTKQH